jgi:hypothetical protein
MAMPEGRGHLFLFHFLCFHHFIANVTRTLPLEAIKGEAGARAGGESQNNQTITTKTQSKPPPLKRLGTCSLSRKLVTPTTSTPVQDNTIRSEIY